MRSLNAVRRSSQVVALVAGTVMAVACSSDSATTTNVEEFCNQTKTNQALIVNPPLGNEDEIEATIEFYRLMGDLAPLQIKSDWQQLADSMETANGVVPGDEQSEQTVAQTAYASERAAYNIATWVEANCGVTLPITTIVPHENDPVSPLDTSGSSPTEGTDTES